MTVTRRVLRASYRQRYCRIAGCFKPHEYSLVTETEKHRLRRYPRCAVHAWQAIHDHQITDVNPATYREIRQAVTT